MIIILDDLGGLLRLIICSAEEYLNLQCKTFGQVQLMFTQEVYYSIFVNGIYLKKYLFALAFEKQLGLAY